MRNKSHGATEKTKKNHTQMRTKMNINNKRDRQRSTANSTDVLPNSKCIHGILHDNSCLQNTAAERRANKSMARIFFPAFAFAFQINFVRRIASSISNAIYWIAETVQCLILSLSNFADRKMAITTNKQALHFIRLQSSSIRPVQMALIPLRSVR